MPVFQGFKFISLFIIMFLKSGKEFEIQAGKSNFPAGLQLIEDWGLKFRLRSGLFRRNFSSIGGEIRCGEWSSDWVVN